MALRRGVSTDEADLVVDFLPGRDVARARVRLLSEGTLLAMFNNNRAAELLAAPHHVAALSNLVGTLRRQGRLTEAEPCHAPAGPLAAAAALPGL